MEKSAFRIDLEGGRATCPGGQEAVSRKVRDGKGRPVLSFAFDRSKCESCPLFSRCVRSKKHGRVVRTHYHESHLVAARRRRETGEFKGLYRTRNAVERKLAELVGHGLRATRYVGKGKRGLRRLWIGAAVNLKRLFKLAEDRGIGLYGLRAILGGSPSKAGLTAA